MLHYIHRHDIQNTGDYKCCPLEYFFYMFPLDYLVHDIYNINYAMIEKNDIVILGGGGLLDCINKWNVSINKLLDICDNVISWGCGFNFYNTIINDKIAFEKFKLLSIRDYRHPSKYKFVPCVSCMMPELSRFFEIKRNIGILEYKDNPIITFSYPKISNKASLDEIIEFIGSSNVIITNSYHACYWATLMKKKVILYNEHSSKFDYIQYAPVKYSGNLRKDIRRAKIYEDALDNCRKTNIEFANNVRNFIKKSEDI